MKKYTRKNPDGSYRVPFNEVGRFRMENDRYSGAYFGDFIDKLGRVEELELDEELLEKLSKAPPQKVKEFLRGLSL